MEKLELEEDRNRYLEKVKSFLIFFIPEICACIYQYALQRETDDSCLSMFHLIIAKLFNILIRANNLVMATREGVVWLQNPGV